MAVRRDDDGRTVLDFLFSQRVFHAAGTVGLDFQRDAQVRGRAAQGLGGHVRVRNAHRAGSHGQKLRMRVRGGHFFPLQVGLRLIEQRTERDGRFGVQEFVAQRPLQQKLGQPREHLHVQICRIFRAEDQKEQVDGLTVERVERASVRRAQDA